MINETFLKFKSNLELNETFDEIIERRHNAVRSVVENNGEGVKTQLIGSLQRKTRIQPKEGQVFDLDILVIMGSFYNWLPAGTPGGVTPEDAMQKLDQIIGKSDRYNAMNPQHDQPVISIKYQDNTKVELVPAYLDLIGSSADGATHHPVGRAYWIPKDGRWVLADYDHEAAHITSLNTITDGWFIPTVKMLKSAKREYFPQLDSFHLEIIAGNIIPTLYLQRKQNNLEISYPVLVTDFFNHADKFLENPIKITGSHSPHYSIDPATKVTLSGMLAQVKDHCNAIGSMANSAEKLKGWRTLFGDAFPTV